MVSRRAQQAAVFARGAAGYWQGRGWVWGQLDGDRPLVTWAASRPIVAGVWALPVRQARDPEAVQEAIDVGRGAGPSRDAR